MQRIPEPELMNDQRQALAYANADFSEPHNAFVKGIAQVFPGICPRHILDLGCGPGDICERLARQFTNARIIAVDAAEAMLAIARKRAGASGLLGRIEYRKTHLPDDSLGGNHDLIVSNSLLHHMNNPLDLWHNIRHCSRPGTAIYVMDLVRPESGSMAKHLVETYAADEADILKQDFYHSLLAAYTPQELQLQLQQSGLACLNVQTTTDRHMLISGIFRS